MRIGSSPSSRRRISDGCRWGRRLHWFEAYTLRYENIPQDRTHVRPLGCVRVDRDRRSKPVPEIRLASCRTTDSRSRSLHIALPRQIVSRTHLRRLPATRTRPPVFLPAAAVISRSERFRGSRPSIPWSRPATFRGRDAAWPRAITKIRADGPTARYLTNRACTPPEPRIVTPRQITTTGRPARTAALIAASTSGPIPPTRISRDRCRPT